MMQVNLTELVFKNMDGAHAAMFTPFTADNRVNPEMIARIMEYGIANGLRGFYLTGSTGEGFLLSEAERKLVMETAVKAAKGRCRLIAHVGCLATDDAVKLARYAADIGIDWVSSVAPVYFGQSFEAAYRHYKMISEATDLPFMVYSIGQALVPERDIRFFDLKNVKGMKYTGRDYYAAQCLPRPLRPADGRRVSGLRAALRGPRHRKARSGACWLNIVWCWGLVGSATKPRTRNEEPSPKKIKRCR